MPGPTTTTIAVTPGSGQLLDAVQLTVNANSVAREIITVGDPTTGAAYAAVENTDPGSSDYGLVVRDVRGNASLPVRVDPTGTTTQPVSIVASQTIAVTQATAASLNATVVGTGTFATQDSNLSGCISASKVAVSGTFYPYTLGQALAASSVPVVLTAAQITTLTPPAAITGFALETGGNLASIKTNTGNIPALGQALAAASVPVVLTAAQLTTLTPPAVFGGVVTQGTGTNLHTVVDSGTITTVSTVTTVSAVTAITNPLPAGTNTIGAVTHVPIATLPYSASVTTAVAVKSSAGTLYGWSILNTTAAIAYVQVFNKGTGSVTLGSTAPDFVIPIPANSTTGAGSNFPIPQGGLTMSTAITIAATTTVSGSTTAACNCLIFYT